MANHLYAIGEAVSFNFNQGQFFSKLTSFKVEALMPPIGTALQYRIKGETEAYSRVVPEDQISSSAKSPDADQT